MILHQCKFIGHDFTKQTEYLVLWQIQLSFFHQAHKFGSQSHLSHFARNWHFAYAQTEMQSSCAVTAQLISPFALATNIVQSLSILNQKF